MEKNHRLVIQGENKPEIKTLSTLIPNRLKAFRPYDTYKLPDFFLPSNMLYGMITSEEWQKNGIEIPALDGHLIYPFYGVWSPTTQEYLHLVNLFLKSINNPRDFKRVIDIGSGTGVLSNFQNHKSI